MPIGGVPVLAGNVRLVKALGVVEPKKEIGLAEYRICPAGMVCLQAQINARSMRH